MQAFVRGKRAQRPRPHPLRPPGGAAPTAGTPALERHTVISSLVRLTCVISLLIDIGPHVLACSSADVSKLTAWVYVSLCAPNYCCRTSCLTAKFSAVATIGPSHSEVWIEQRWFKTSDRCAYPVTRKYIAECAQYYISRARRASTYSNYHMSRTAAAVARTSSYYSNVSPTASDPACEAPAIPYTEGVNDQLRSRVEEFPLRISKAADYHCHNASNAEHREEYVWEYEPEEYATPVREPDDGKCDATDYVTGEETEPQKGRPRYRFPESYFGQ